MIKWYECFDGGYEHCNYERYYFIQKVYDSELFKLTVRNNVCNKTDEDLNVNMKMVSLESAKKIANYIEKILSQEK